MKNAFLIFGYGIPKDILKDENYGMYLKTAFNRIYDASAKSKDKAPLIIFCGGKTDIRKPYLRTEAQEMMRFFKELITQRPYLKTTTAKWKFATEKNSISTVENLLFSKMITDKKKSGHITVFCEYAREKRIATLAKKIFGNKCNMSVEAIDFDVSPNRYLGQEFLARKEKMELEKALWALKSPANMKKYRALFEERLRRFRTAGPKSHTQEIQAWWEEQINKIGR